MTRIVETKPPSFPKVEPNRLLQVEEGVRWQVVCGDEGHWRVGVYSPEFSSPEELSELEKHDCPEFFLLLSGKVTLLMAKEGKLVEQPLEAGKPILVDAPHTGFCPEGAFSGIALVVERDEFETIYRSIPDWLQETAK